MNSNNKKEGFINAWFPDRAFGFVHANTDGTSNRTLQVYFFHISSLLSGNPVKGAAVRFNIGSNVKGLTALDVEVLGTRLEDVQAGA